MMRLYLPFLLMLALLMTAACVEEYTPEKNVPVATATVTTIVSETTTPAGTPTPEPEPVAYLSGITCAVGDRSEAAYHCNGDVRIRTGAYEEVQVIAMYADNNVFRSGAVSLGGGDVASKPFAIFPDVKYKGQNPTYFVRLDNIYCPVSWSGSTGVAMTNMPVPDAIKARR